MSINIFFRKLDCKEIVENAMNGYDIDVYEENNMNVTEEEFVFDSLHNVTLVKIMNIM